MYGKTLQFRKSVFDERKRMLTVDWTGRVPIAMRVCSWVGGGGGGGEWDGRNGLSLERRTTRWRIISGGGGTGVVRMCGCRFWESFPARLRLSIGEPTRHYGPMRLQMRERGVRWYCTQERRGFVRGRGRRGISKWWLMAV
jgi:hypothetical protein